MSEAIQKASSAIDAALAECNSSVLATLPMMKQAIVLGAGIAQLRKVLTNELVAEVFMPLQGTMLGFLTDRDNAKEGPKQYGIEVVREVMIEAMIKGIRPVNNELNIIAGRLYVAKNGVQRLVHTFPGLTDLTITPGVPYMVGEQGALVAMRADFCFNGRQQSIVRDLVKRADGTPSDTRIPVKVNRTMGPDAIIGKAVRKLYKQIHDQISGMLMSVDDGDAIDTTGEVVVGRSPAEVVAEQMAARAQPAPQPAPEPVATKPVVESGTYTVGGGFIPTPPASPPAAKPGITVEVRRNGEKYTPDPITPPPTSTTGFVATGSAARKTRTPRATPAAAPAAPAPPPPPPPVAINPLAEAAAVAANVTPIHQEPPPIEIPDEEWALVMNDAQTLQDLKDAAGTATVDYGIDDEEVSRVFDYLAARLSGA